MTQLYCPGGIQSKSGISSQSGVASQDRYPDAAISNSGDLISDIERIINENPGPYVIPIWNSHQGSIPASLFIWNHIEAEQIKIYDLWPKEIEFSLVKRKGTNEIKNIISVTVAEQQCSKFLSGYKFTGTKLTTVAFDEFIKDTNYHGVLVAPQSSLSDEYTIVEDNVANDNNFTAFINFYGLFEWVYEKKKHFLTAITTSRLSSGLSDQELALFDNLFTNVDDISKIPRLIFVFELDDKVGLIFEGDQISAGDLLTSEEMQESDIRIYEEVGSLEMMYSETLKGLLETRFPTLTQGDFLIHNGSNTFMFACPALGIYTHGYKRDAVEPVVRFYMHKVFETIKGGAKVTPEQRGFFSKYEAAWNANPLNFMQYIEVE